MSNNNQQPTHKTGRLTTRKNANGDSQTPNAEIKPQKDSDEVLGAIEGVEKQLEALRGAHEEHRKLNAELSARRAQIDEVAEQVEARESELSAREVELAEMRQELEDRETEIVQRASGLEQRESQMAQHAESVEELEAVVETKSKQIDERVAELDRQLEGITVRKDELAKLEEQAKARLEEDSKLQSQINLLTEELEKTKATLGGREIELKERSKVVEDLAVQAGILEKQMAEMSLRAQADEDDSLKMIEDMQNQLDEALEKLGAHDQEMQSYKDRIDELEMTTAERESELQEAVAAVAKLSELEDTLNQTKSNSAEQIEALETKLTKAQSDFNAAKELLEAAPSDEMIQAVQSQLDQTTSELKAAQSNASELQNQLDAVGASATEELEASKAQIAALTNELSDAQSSLDKAIAQREQMKDELQSQLNEAIESGKLHQDSSGAQLLRVAELESKLVERDEQVATIRTKYDELSEQLINEQVKAEETQTQIDRLGELLDAASKREQTLMEDLKALNELLESAQSEGVVKTDEWTKSRRERLDRVKAILRQQSDKIRRATEALRDRYDQCEKVLLKRAELVEAYQAVADAQSKLAKREARSGTLLGLSGLGLLLMMIAGISWFVAGQVAPGTYASQVTLVAKAGERNISTADIASWQGYIEQLVSDPQFVEQAAMRMKRRGIEDLSVAGTLASVMSESLDVSSAEPGRIELEFRGDGAGYSQRVMDTFALTVTSHANGARARRIDGALTTIESAASTGKSPLDTKRIETAGMFFGGSSLATFTFGGIFWRRLAKMKANFERDSRVEPLFDNESWEVEGKDA